MLNILNVIDMLYVNNISNISKFELYKLIKNNDKNLSYYKIKILLHKLIETKIIIPINKNNYYFNKIKNNRQLPITIVFN